MARERTVFPTPRIAHIWVHGPQQAARNPQDNLYFNGKILYSYRDSFPIGRLVDRPGKVAKGMIAERAVLIQQDRYSNTTAKHVGMAWSATSHLKQFEVPELGGTRNEGLLPSDHEFNLKWMSEKIQEEIGSAMRARSSKAWKIERAEGRIKSANEYCEFFRLRKRFNFGVTPEALEQLKTNAKVEKDKADKKHAKQCERARIEHEEEQKRALPEALARIAAWENGSGGLRYGDTRICGRGTMLRVIGGEVETSQGAVFPVEHARLGLRLVRSVLSSGTAWETNDHTCHLGPYKVDKIEANGTVYAGCHVVEWREIERIAGEIEFRCSAIESHKNHSELQKDNREVNQ